MSTFAVTYHYTDDVAKRDEVRPTHREFLLGLHAEGVVRASGPADGGSGALVIVEADSADAALSILDADPFVAQGVVAERSARQWEVVIGGFAE